MKAAFKPTVEAIQLLSGQWLIAKVVENDGLDLTLSLPAAPMFQPSPDGTQQLTFIPYAPLVKNQKKVAIPLGMVLIHQEAEEKIKSFYQQATGDIVTPSSGLIIAKS